jgi:putative transcriptional regulator
LAALSIARLATLALAFALGTTLTARAAGVLPAKGVFLVATENLDGTSFERTVILLTHVDPGGAMGIALNRRSGYLVSQFFEGLDPAPLFLGGPVRPDALFVLAQNPKVPRRSHVVEDIYLVSGPDAHAFLTPGVGKHAIGDPRAFAGFSGWAPGQLEAEIQRGDWETIAAEARFALQKDTETLWPTLLQLARARWI